jgi:hypothetical protein
MKTLIDLLLESELAEMNDKETVDEVGKFFIVKKPGKGMTKDDFRESKKSIEDKKKIAKEKIERLK